MYYIQKQTIGAKGLPIDGQVCLVCKTKSEALGYAKEMVQEDANFQQWNKITPRLVKEGYWEMIIGGRVNYIYQVKQTALKDAREIEFKFTYEPTKEDYLALRSFLEEKNRPTPKQSTLFINNQNSTTMSRVSLGGTPYLNRKTGEQIVKSNGKIKVWGPRVYQNTDKKGNCYLEIDMPKSMVARPNNFFQTGCKHKKVMNKATGREDIVTYVKGYIRLGRKTQSGHDARVYYVAREFYMGGQPGLFDVHYKGDNYRRSEDVFNDIPFNDGWVKTFKDGQDVIVQIHSDGTRKSQIEYVQSRREKYKAYKAGQR